MENSGGSSSETDDDVSSTPRLRGSSRLARERDEAGSATPRSGTTGAASNPRDAPRKVACDSCRIRRKQCDGVLPVCGGCRKTGNECHYYGLGKKPSRTGKGGRSRRTNRSRRGGDESDRDSPVPSTEVDISGILNIFRTPAAAVGTGPTSAPVVSATTDRSFSFGTNSTLDDSRRRDSSTSISVNAMSIFSDLGNFENGSTSGSNAPLLKSEPGITTRALSVVVPAPLSPFPDLPSPSLIFAMFERFFVTSDLVYPTIHRGRFYETFPPPPLLLSSMLLYTPVFDPTALDLLENAGMTRKEYDRLLFMRAKAELAACVQFMPSDSFSPKEAETALISTLFLGIWSSFHGMAKLGASLYHMTLMLTRKAGWMTSAANPAPSFRRLLVDRFGEHILTAALQPKDVSMLRNLWLEQAVQHRVMNIFGLSVQTRKDWTRVVEDPTEPDDFAIAHRPAPPTSHHWELSLNPTWDPRSAYEPPLLFDMFSWMDMDRNDPRRIHALHALSDYTLHVRGTLPWLHAKLRDLVDGFLRACKAAGLSSPADLPPVAKVDPRRLSREQLDSLYQMRAHVEAVMFDLQNALPPEMVRGWLAGSAAQMMAPLLPYHPFHNVYNIMNHIPAMLMMRSELYTSLGSCFSEGLLTDSTQVKKALEALADEFGTSREPFGYFLEQSLLFTQFQNDLFSMNPNLFYHTAADTAVIMRVAVLHIAFFKRFRSASLQTQQQMGSGSTSSAPPSGEIQVSPAIMAQVAHDVNVLLRVLQAQADRHGPGPLTTAYTIIKKLHEDAELEENEVEAMKLKADDARHGEVEAEEVAGSGPGMNAVVKEGLGVVDRGLANLIAAYERRGGVAGGW